MRLIYWYSTNPRNDLDVETLEVLEARLSEYRGTLIVVSHDREFLDNVITSTLVFERAGKIGSYVGGYSDWLRQGNVLTDVDKLPNRSVEVTRNDPLVIVESSSNKKLTFKLKHELDQLPSRIDELEAELSALHEQTSAAGFYQRPFEQTQPIIHRLAACQTELDQAIERWGELESMQ